MSLKNIICTLCGNEIQSGQPRFYFPRLPPNHPLADVQGILHISCLKEADGPRKIGESLAKIAKDLAIHSQSVPLISWDGNIVLRDRLDESRIEVLDFEDFCEISIPRSILGKLQAARLGESIVLGMQILHITQDGTLELESKAPPFVVCLSALGLSRLQQLVE